MRFRYFVLVMLAGLSPWMLKVQGSMQQNFESDIAKADEFYDQGRFSEALALLTPLDASLAKNNRSAADQARIKMLIGLTQIAVGDTDHARASFVQFCSVSPNYVIDEAQYPRKVVTVFKEAQQECSKCVQICKTAESMAVQNDVLGTASTKGDTEYCSCASRNQARDEAALAPGRALMAQAKYSEALKEFQKTLGSVPDSAARREAVKTAQAKVDSTVEAAIKEWRELFLSREFERAAATYDRIRRTGDDASEPVKAEIRQVTEKYQSTFQNLTASWTAACSSNDRVTLNAVQEWGKSLDPNRTIQPAALDRMRECASSPGEKVNGSK